MFIKSLALLGGIVGTTFSGLALVTPPPKSISIKINKIKVPKIVGRKKIPEGELMIMQNPLLYNVNVLLNCGSDMEEVWVTLSADTSMEVYIESDEKNVHCDILSWDRSRV